VDPDFAEGVEAGRYRYVSASFYPPSDPNNPKPGNWYLRHIGFLGAQPPAVKGLAPAFAEAAAAGLVEFAAADASTVQSLFRGIRDWMIEKEGLDTADKVIPSWYIDSLETYSADSSFAEAGRETLAGNETAAATITAGNGTDTVQGAEGADAAFAERAAQLEAREAEIRQREAAFAEGERTRARAEDQAFLDGLVSAGRLPPTQAPRVAALFARLDGDQSIAFAEASADPRAELRGLLAGLGTAIHFAEVAAGDGFDANSAEAVPQIAAEITRIRNEAAERGESISFSEAAARLGR
jgi:phosphoglycolate phosphatase-like HAD superfamily hydrolase